MVHMGQYSTVIIRSAYHDVPQMGRIQNSGPHQDSIMMMMTIKCVITQK